jgi:hypothetical protein
MQIELSKKQFKRQFLSEMHCYNYLIKNKWPNGFVCRRCRNTSFYKGKSEFHRRCKACRYDESPTANTLFHKLKFPVSKAFSIVYELLKREDGMSSCELARTYSLQQSTTWLFKRKVIQAMTRLHTSAYWVSLEDDRLKPRGMNLSKILLAEAAIGTGVDLEVYPRLHPFKGHYFIESVKFRAFPQAIESNPNNVYGQKRIHSKAKGNAWMFSLVNVFEENVQMKIDYLHGLSSWIRNTHRHVSPKHLFFYCSEYAYRFFSIRKKSKGFPRLIQAIILHPKLEYKQLVDT